MVLVVIPCHKEKTNVLLETMQSVLQLDHPHNRLNVFLSFDGYENEATFNAILKEFGCEDKLDENKGFRLATSSKHGSRMTISMFKHGGKPHVQGQTINYIQKHHEQYVDDAHNTFVLLLDSDTTIGPRDLSSLLSCFASLCFDTLSHNACDGLGTRVHI